MKRSGTKKIVSPTKQKVLLLLMAGIILSLSRSPSAPRRVFRALKKDWHFISRQYLHRIVREFREERLVDYREQSGGIINIVITEAGREKTLAFKIDSMEISKPTRWDGKWRLVCFDIPERQRPARDALRHKLRELGFKELQKSTFIFPYPCENEINFIVEFFEIRRFVRYAEIVKLTNDSELKLHFDLI